LLNEKIIPSTPPSSCAKRLLSIVWNVIPTTWHTNFLIESWKPTILSQNSDIDNTRSQKCWKSHRSKMSPRYMIWLMGSSDICKNWHNKYIHLKLIINNSYLYHCPIRLTSFSLRRHLHSTKSVCGRFVKAFNNIWHVISMLNRCGFNWYSFKTAKFASKSYAFSLDCISTYFSRVMRLSGLYLKQFWYNKYISKIYIKNNTNRQGWWHIL